MLNIDPYLYIKHLFQLTESKTLLFFLSFFNSTINSGYRMHLKPIRVIYAISIKDENNKYVLLRTASGMGSYCVYIMV